jgi:hypothetical protein
MKLDIDKLTEEELIYLNHRIVEWLRFLSQMRAHSQMLDFRIGDRVTFQPEGRPPVVGMLTRYNKKTVTVITDSGQHWNVTLGLFRRQRHPIERKPTKRKWFRYERNKSLPGVTPDG